VLPVFSSVAALVRALGRCQPWVCVPLRAAREAADRAGLIQVVVDPGASSSRSQVAVRTNRAAVSVTWEQPSVNVRQRPLVNVAIVTQLVTRSLWGRLAVCRYGWSSSPSKMIFLFTRFLSWP